MTQNNYIKNNKTYQLELSLNHPNLEKFCQKDVNLNLKWGKFYKLVVTSSYSPSPLKEGGEAISVINIGGKLEKILLKDKDGKTTIKVVILSSGWVLDLETKEAYGGDDLKSTNPRFRILSIARG